MGFFFNSTRLFGLPEREDTLMLKNTQDTPYELFATDQPMHPPNNPQPLYGSIPYITSITKTHSSAVVWMNAAHTFAGISDMQDGKYANFVSESGAVEFFVFASSTAGASNRFKKVQ